MNNEYQIVLRLLLSLLLGALIGLERDQSWKKKDNRRKVYSKFKFMGVGRVAQSLGGVRTFSLISLLGTVSGLIAAFGFPSIVVIAFFALTLLLIVSYVVNYLDQNTLGLTTEVTIFITFLSGLLLSITSIPLKIVVLINVFVALIMSLRFELRSLIARFRREEVTDTIEFALITCVILPFLPNQDIRLLELSFIEPLVAKFGPSLTILNDVFVFNPYQFWLVIVFISSLSFIGYFLGKIIGQKKGILLTGFLGGIISSTAVTKTMSSLSKTAKTVDQTKALLASTIIANATSFIRILIILFGIHTVLVRYLWLPFIAMSLVTIIISIFYSVTSKSRRTSSDLTKDVLFFKTPLALKPALIFGVLFTVVTIFSRLALVLVGNQGLVITTIISSIAGLDAITLTLAKFNINGIVGIEITVILLFLAAAANLLIKLVFVFLDSSKAYRYKLTLAFILTIIVGLIALQLNRLFI